MGCTGCQVWEAGALDCEGSRCERYCEGHTWAVGLQRGGRRDPCRCGCNHTGGGGAGQPPGKRVPHGVCTMELLVGAHQPLHLLLLLLLLLLLTHAPCKACPALRRPLPYLYVITAHHLEQNNYFHTAHPKNVTCLHRAWPFGEL